MILFCGDECKYFKIWGKHQITYYISTGNQYLKKKWNFVQSWKNQVFLSSFTVQIMVNVFYNCTSFLEAKYNKLLLWSNKIVHTHTHIHIHIFKNMLWQWLFPFSQGKFKKQINSLQNINSFLFAFTMIPSLFPRCGSVLILLVSQMASLGKVLRKNIKSVKTNDRLSVDLYLYKD